MAGTSIALPEEMPVHPSLTAEAAAGNINFIVPRDLKEALEMAIFFIKSGAVPDGYREDPKNKQSPIDPNMVAVAIIKGMEVGIPPITALGGIYIVGGKPTIWGDVAMGLIHRHNLIADIAVTLLGKEEIRVAVTADGQEKDFTPLPADFGDSYGFNVKLWRRGTISPFEWTYTVRDARRAKLWMKHAVWLQNPKRMLFLRSRGVAQRDGFADALGGMMTTEEAQDMLRSKMADEVQAKPNLSFLRAAPKRAALAAPTDQAVNVEVAPSKIIQPEPVSSGARTPAEEEALREIVTRPKAEPLPPVDHIELTMLDSGKPDFDSWCKLAAAHLPTIKTPREVDAWMKEHEPELNKLKMSGKNGIEWHKHLIATGEERKSQLRGNA